MQGINSDDFAGLKSITEMGFSSIVQILNTINDENLKTRKIIGSILDRIDNISDNIGQTINTSIGKIGIGSFTNYSKLSYKLQIDIHKTLLKLSTYQKKFFDFLIKNKKLSIDITHEQTKPNIPENTNQGALIGGQVINANNIYNFNINNTNNKTIESFTKMMKEVNKFMSIKDNKFKIITNFFKDFNSQLLLLKQNLVPVSLGFAMLAGSLILLQYVSFINVFKLASILPILGIGIALFITGIVSATKKIGGGISGMFKFWMIMKALPDIFLNLGKGILLLSIGLVLFNLVGYDSILKLITTMISLGIAFKLMAGGDDSWTGTAKLFIVIGIILATTHALISTKDIPWNSVLKLPIFIGSLGLALHIGGFDKFEKIKVMNMLAISLLLMTLSLLTFNYISWENIIKYNVFISLLGLSLRSVKKDISVMSLMALGFIALTAALLDFQELNWMSMIQIIGVIGLLGVVVNKFVLGRLNGGAVGNMSESLSGGGFRGGGLIGFALGLFLLTFAIERFSHIKWQSVFKAITIITVLGLVFKIFFQEKTSGFLGNKKTSIQVPSMIGFALGLGLLVLALDAVSEIEWKSVFQLVALMVAIGLIFKFLMPQKSKTSGMLGFALGVGLLLLALDAMSEISWESVFKLVTFMVGVGGALWLIKGVGFWQMIALAGSIFVMVYTLEYLNKVNPKIENILNFGLFVAVAAAAMYFIGTNIVNIALGVAAVLGIGWATGVMADALAKVSSLKFNLEGTLVWFGGVILLGLAMAGIGALLFGTGGVAALFIGAGALAIIAIAWASGLMADALSEISKLKYSETSFDQFSYGIKKIINAYIDLDPIATIASSVTAVATLPILITSLVAIGILKLIDYTFGNNKTLIQSTNSFTLGLSNLINSFNNNINAWVVVKASLKSVGILPILGTMFLASLLLAKISKTEWEPKRLDSFNLMFSKFIEDTVETINTHKDAIISAGPGIKNILRLINVASSLANVVKDISSLRFVEMGVVNGKIVVKNIRQLGPNDFENVGKSIAKLILALINPIKVLGSQSDIWRIGSDTIPNPFKNDTFNNGIDNIKKISEAFKPLVDSVVNYSKTGIAFDYGKMNRFEYSLKTTAQTYGYVFWKLAQIKKANLLKDAFITIEKIQEYNEIWEDLDFDSFKEFNNIFNNFIDKLSDANKWKIIHKNITILTANLQKAVKSINSIDLEKAAALEVNVKQLSDKNNIQQIKEVIEQFVNLFGIIGQNQYQQSLLFGNNVNAFNGGVNTFVENANSVNTARNNNMNPEGNKLLNDMKNGEFSLKVNNLTDGEKEINKKENFDMNNDGIINNTDINLMNGMEGKIDKLIAVLQNYNSPFRK